MRGGSPEQFYELLFEGEEVGFTVNGKNYFSQGYCIDGVFYREVVCYKKEDWEKVFFVRGDRNTDFTKAFVKAPIFDGKTFWEVEEDIHWTTDEFEKYPDYDIDIYEEAIIPYRRVGNFHFKDSEEQIVVLLKEKNISFLQEKK